MKKWNESNTVARLLRNIVIILLLPIRMSSNWSVSASITLYNYILGIVAAYCKPCYDLLHKQIFQKISSYILVLESAAASWQTCQMLLFQMR